MKGGGNSKAYTDEELEILKQYGLAEDGPIAKDIDEITKREFLKQLGNCKVGTGNSVILSKNCSAVLTVIRALIKSGIRKANKYDLSSYDKYANNTITKNNISLSESENSSSQNSNTEDSVNKELEVNRLTETNSENSTNTTNKENEMPLTSIDPSYRNVTAEEPVVKPILNAGLQISTEFEYDPKNFKENKDGRASLNINTSRSNKRFVSNVKLNGRRTRIRATTPVGLLKRYNYEKSLLNTTRKMQKRANIHAEKRKIEAEREKQFTARKQLQTKKEEAISAERKANALKRQFEEAKETERLAKKAAENAAVVAGTKKRGTFSRFFKLGGKRTRKVRNSKS